MLFSRLLLLASSFVASIAASPSEETSEETKGTQPTKYKESEVVPDTYEFLIHSTSDLGPYIHARRAVRLHEEDPGTLDGLISIIDIREVRRYGFWGQFSPNTTQRIRNHKDIRRMREVRRAENHPTRHLPRTKFYDWEESIVKQRNDI